MNLAPSEATCSLAAGRTSVAETTAPRRRAVAIACRPATPCPHDENLGSRHCAGSRHHHRHGAVIFRRGVDHRLVTGKIGLRGQHVHRLGAGDARHQFHRKGGQPGLGHVRQCLIVAIGIHDCHDDGAGFVALATSADVGRRTFSTTSALAASALRNRSGTGLLELAIGNTRQRSGTGLNDNLEAEGLELLHTFR
jgi:hypothetical protein